MSKEISFPATTGGTCYAIVTNATGQAWNTATPAFESLASADWANYVIACTEAATSTGIFQGNFPSGISVPGRYSVLAYKQAGGSPAVSDTVVAKGDIDWSGTAPNYTGGAVASVTAGVTLADGAITPAKLAASVYVNGTTVSGDRNGCVLANTEPSTAGAIPRGTILFFPSLRQCGIVATYGTGQAVTFMSPVPTAVGSTGYLFAGIASGYELAATGLDSITVTEPVGPSSGWNFREWMRWTAMRFVNAARSPTTLTVKTLAGATSTTQAVTDDGAGNETTGPTS